MATKKATVNKTTKKTTTKKGNSPVIEKELPMVETPISKVEEIRSTEEIKPVVSPAPIERTEPSLTAEVISLMKFQKKLNLMKKRLSALHPSSSSNAHKSEIMNELKAFGNESYNLFQHIQKFGWVIKDEQLKAERKNLLIKKEKALLKVLPFSRNSIFISTIICGNDRLQKGNLKRLYEEIRKTTEFLFLDVTTETIANSEKRQLISEALTELKYPVSERDFNKFLFGQVTVPSFE
jgi:hypothetical protein